MSFFLISFCKPQKDFLYPFEERIEKKKGLFNLLDEYPALKNFFSNAEPNQFNYKLGDSLSFYPDAAIGGMRSLEIISFKTRSEIQRAIARFIFFIAKD